MTTGLKCSHCGRALVRYAKTIVINGETAGFGPDCAKAIATTLGGTRRARRSTPVASASTEPEVDPRQLHLFAAA